ncbi:hypothetical protein ABK040_006029 [Willaertia magna]
MGQSCAVIASTNVVAVEERLGVHETAIRKTENVVSFHQYDVFTSEKYKVSFVKEYYSSNLEKQQKINETAQCRRVILVDREVQTETQIQISYSQAKNDTSTSFKKNSFNVATPITKQEVNTVSNILLGSNVIANTSGSDSSVVVKSPRMDSFRGSSKKLRKKKSSISSALTKLSFAKEKPSEETEPQVIEETSPPKDTLSVFKKRTTVEKCQMIEDARRSKDSSNASSLTVSYPDKPSYFSDEIATDSDVSSSSGKREVCFTTTVKTGFDKDGKKMVNEYTVVRKLGKGVHGKVKLCVNKVNTSLCAMKIINKSLLNRLKKDKLGRPVKQSGMRKLLKEIAILKKVHHPNVVDLYEVIDDPENEKLFLVFEYIERGCLMKIVSRDCVDRQPFSEDLCRKYFRDLICGLEYLHENKIVHRDIKPENLLLTNDDRLKITDFGVSYMLEGDDDVLTTSAGTPAFLSPEACAVGKYNAIPSDIWAAGVTLFVLYFGKLPFFGPGILGTFHAILNDEPEYPEGAPPLLVDLLKLLLEKDSQKRITIKDIKVHPWITKKGTWPFITNVDRIKQSTDQEIETAITVGRETKAIDKFFLLSKIKSRLKHRANIAREKIRQRRIENSKEEISSNHIKVGKNIFFQLSEEEECIFTPIIDFVDEKNASYFNSVDNENHGKSMGSILTIDLSMKHIQTDDELLELIEKEGLYTKKESIQQLSTTDEDVNNEMFEDCTEEEIQMVKKRIREQKLLYKQLEKRDRKNRIFQVRSVHKHITNEEALYSLEMCNNVEEEAILKLTDTNFLQQVRKKIALDYDPNPSLIVEHLVPIAQQWQQENNNNITEYQQIIQQPCVIINPVIEQTAQESEPSNLSDEDLDDKDDDDFVMSSDGEDKKVKKTTKKPKIQAKKPKSQPKKTKTKKKKIIESDIEEEENEEEREEKKKRKKKVTNCPRLLLNDALGDVQTKEGWSKARIEAYAKIKTNPNAYYYRFNEPGEQQKNGKWTRDEKELFIKKLKEYAKTTDNFQWGIFSKMIPGRVGYQCQQQYRTLLKTKEIKTDIVEECKERISGKVGCKRKKSDSSNKKKSTKKKKIIEEEEEEFDYENIDEKEEVVTASSSDASSSTSNDIHDINNDNPLRGVIDPITQYEIEKPAISPFGHVLGYNTWIKILNSEPKNTCPFTKQILRKRALVKLTYDNIDEYKDKIRNLTIL